MKTRQRQLLNRLICHIILYTFLWVTFAPGLTFAAGPTPPSSSKSSKGKKKAVTKRKVPRNPQEAEKMYAARDQARIKKAQAKHKAASDALDKKKEKQSDQDKPKNKWISCSINDDGSVIEITPEGTKEYKIPPPLKNSKLALSRSQGFSTRQWPTAYTFYREVLWPDDSLYYYFDATPPNSALKRYISASGSNNESVPKEYLFRYNHVAPSNPTGETNYYIAIHIKYTSPYSGHNNYNDGSGSYQSVIKDVYSSWYDGEGNKHYRKRSYGEGVMYYDSGVQDGWLTGWNKWDGITVSSDSDVGTYNVKSYEGLSSDPDDPIPGSTPLFNYDFPNRKLSISTFGLEPVAPSLEAAIIKFNVSYEDDDWDPGTATYKVRIKSGDGTVKRTLQGSITGDQVKCEWNGRDDNDQAVTQGIYTAEAMVTSETEYTRAFESDESETYNKTAWIDIGSTTVLKTEKGLGFQFTNKNDPVNVSSGNYYLETKDLSIPARGIPFNITRYHNSLNPHHGLFGFGWCSSISPYLDVLESGNIKIMNPDGEFNHYTRVNSTTYTPMAGVHSTLVKNTDGSYTLTHKDKSVTNFNSQGNISSVKDANDNTLTYHYDTTSKLTSISDASSRYITFSYDDNPRITKITDFANRETTYSYNSSGHLTRVTDPMGYTNAYSYNSKHQILGVWDGKWNEVVANTYNDTTGRVSNQTLADNTQVSYTYDTTARTAVITTGSQSDTYYYDSNDNLTKEVDPLGAEITYAYDSSRNMTSVTDPLGHLTAFEYDTGGNRTKVTDADSNITTTTYDSTFNKPTQITTPLSQVTQFAYDTKGNLTKTTDPLNRDTTIEYDTYGQLTKTTDPLSHNTTYAYDSYGNMTSTTNSLSKTTTFAYDSVGNMTSTTDPLSHSITKTYNNNNWLTSVTNPLSQTTNLWYDANGNHTWTQNARGHWVEYTYDSMNRMTTVQSTPITASYYYDSYGNMTRMADGRSNSTYYYFNNANRLTSVTDPLSRSTTFAYDAAGNMTGRTDAKSQTTTLAYDVLNRLTSKSGAISVSYAYDDIGRRTSMTDSTGTTTYSYNTVNQLTSTTVPGNKTIAYAYNSVGALTSRTDAGGVATTFEYDNGNRLTSTTRATKTMTYGYDDANRPTNKTYPNGVQGQFSYDNANQVTSMSYLNGGTPIWSCQYAYDSVGNRTSRTIGTVTYGYEYDAADQLINFKINNILQTSYLYDDAGNRTQKVFMGTPTVYGYDAANQMTSAGAPSQLSLSEESNLTFSVKLLG